MFFKMKPLLSLLSLVLVLAVVRASDSDSDIFAFERDEDANLTDTEMKKFNQRLDKIADRTQRSYEKRLKSLQKDGCVLSEAEKKKVFKDCFQKKFDYADGKTGDNGSIFDLGDRNIFQQEEV